MIPYPEGMSFRDWADQVSYELEPWVPVSRVETDDWQDWGSRLLRSAELGETPNPYDFTDWRTWADSLIAALN